MESGVTFLGSGGTAVPLKLRRLSGKRSTEKQSTGFSGSPFRNLRQSTAWDSAKEYRPLYLVENWRLQSPLERDSNAEPLPPLSLGLDLSSESKEREPIGVNQDVEDQPAPSNLSDSTNRDADSALLQDRVLIEAKTSFVIEEFGDSDYEEFDSDANSVIRPHHYEDGESDRASPVKLATVNSSHVNTNVQSDLYDLNFKSDEGEEETLAWLEMKRAEKRRKRWSSGGMQKRTLAQSNGSDTDDEDLQPIIFEGANEAGSSARRLRRRVTGRKTTLVFDDPPPRIEEEEKPGSSNEPVESDAMDRPRDSSPHIDYMDEEERHAWLESREEERKKKSSKKRRLSEEAEPDEYAT